MLQGEGRGKGGPERCVRGVRRLRRKGRVQGKAEGVLRSFKGKLGN